MTRPESQARYNAAEEARSTVTENNPCTRCAWFGTDHKGSHSLEEKPNARYRNDRKGPRYIQPELVRADRAESS